VHLFEHWLDQQGALNPIVSQLQQAIAAHQSAHPGDDFALLHHRDATLRRRFQALLFAPLLGIDRLTEFDTHEHPLATLLGRSYQSSTLTQFLGQLERIGAHEALLPALVPAQAGHLTYIDGHMIAFYVAAVVKPSCILFSPLSSLGAVSHRAELSCGFLWRAALP
jgi:hypothetical protein